MFRFNQIFNSFRKNTRANIAVSFSLALIPILAGIGVAVDMSHLHSARNEMQDGLDAAVLSGTSTLLETNGNEQKALQAARVAYEKALKGQINLTDNTIKFEINEKKNGVKAKGGAFLKMELLQIVGINKMAVMQDAKAEGQINAGGSGGNLEVALMLDMTGSMCANGAGPCTSGTKLSGVKTAATKLVDTVVWSDQSTYTSKVSLVPFNNVVRVGPDGGGAAMMKTMTNLPATWTGYYKECTGGSSSGGTAEGGANWTCNGYQTLLRSNWKIQPCVTDRFYGGSTFELTDTAPGSNFWMNSADGMRYFQSEDSSDTNFGNPTIGQTAANPVSNWNYETTGICNLAPNQNELMPLTNDKSSLKSKISGLEAKGGTGGALGTAMSWYTISPNWASVWPTTSKPASYSDVTAKKVRKVAILMSDGGYNSYRGWVDQSHLQMVSDAAKSLCTNMKAKGIEIFTVAYDLDTLTSAEASYATDTLKSCGTDIKHFYNSLDATQLATAFDAIAKEISGSTSGVRLVQ
jgi:Flp pilus assembly protein TadG